MSGLMTHEKCANQVDDGIGKYLTRRSIKKLTFRNLFHPLRN